MIDEEGSSGNRIERKKEVTKSKIVTVAMKLSKENGFEATTMERIAEEVDIAKGTLYNYFPVKEAIIEEYIRLQFKDKNSERILQLRKAPDTKSRMILIISELMSGVQAQKEIFEKYIIYRMQNMISFRPDERKRSGIGLLIGEIIELGQRSSEIRNDLPLYILEDLFEFVFIEVAKQFYLNQDKFVLHEALEQGVDLFMNGVKVKSEGRNLDE